MDLASITIVVSNYCTIEQRLSSIHYQLQFFSWQYIVSFLWSSTIRILSFLTKARSIFRNISMFKNSMMVCASIHVYRERWFFQPLKDGICEMEDIDEIPYWPNLGPPQTRSNIHWSILARILYHKSLQNMKDLI